MPAVLGCINDWQFRRCSGSFLPRYDMKLLERDAAVRWPPRPIRSIGVLLLPGYSLMSYACALEPLRAANVLSGHKLYEWKHISIDGRPAQASNGVQILPDNAVGDAISDGIIFERSVIAKGGIRTTAMTTLMSSLREGYSRRVMADANFRIKSILEVILAIVSQLVAEYGIPYAGGVGNAVSRPRRGRGRSRWRSGRSR